MKNPQSHYYYYCIIIIGITERGGQNLCPGLQFLRGPTGPHGSPASLSATIAGCLLLLHRCSETRDRQACLRGCTQRWGRDDPGEKEFLLKIPATQGPTASGLLDLLLTHWGPLRRRLMHIRETDGGAGPGRTRRPRFQDRWVWWRHKWVKHGPCPECRQRQAPRFPGACVTEMQWAVLISSPYQSSWPSV